MTKKRYHIIASCYDSRGKLISSASNNHRKSHPIQAHFASLANEPVRIYLHAEILALLRAGDKKVHTIHVRNTNGADSTPCKVCALAIQQWGVKNVITETTDFSSGF